MEDMFDKFLYYIKNNYPYPLTENILKMEYERFCEKSFEELEQDQLEILRGSLHIGNV